VHKCRNSRPDPLGVDDRIRLPGLVLFVSFLLLGLKVYRVLHLGLCDSPAGCLDLIKSDFFLYLGLFLLVRAAAGSWKAIVPRMILRILVQLVFLVLLASEFLNHHYFLSTGSILDWNLVVYSLQRFGQVWQIVQAELSYGLIALLGGLILVLMLFPWIPLPLYGGVPRENRKSKSWIPILAGLCLILLAVVLPPLVRSNGAILARNFTITLLEQAVYDPGETRVESASPLPYSHDVTVTRESSDPPLNVVLIVMEAARASAVTPYNPDLDTTPFLDRLSRESLIARHAYTVVPHTSKALVQILCGIEPNFSLEITEALPGGLPSAGLPEYLGRVGYDTAFFQGATKLFENREQLVKNLGFSEFFPLEAFSFKGFERVNWFGYEEDIMLEPTRAWLEGHRDHPFFLTYLTVSSHYEYLAPKRYGLKIYSKENRFLDGYLNTIRYQDRFISNLFDVFRSAGLYDSTLFVITGDHGEAFEEHGQIFHDNVMYQEGIQVPLLFHLPGKFSGGEDIQIPVSHLDILPTVLELTGVRLSGFAYPGTSLFQLPAERTVRVHSWFDRRDMALVGLGWKFIYNFGLMGDEYFDLVKDPGENDNRIEEVEDQTETWRAGLLDWDARVRKTYRNHIETLLNRYVTASVPEIAHPLHLAYGDQVELLGYDTQIRRDALADWLEITTVYRVLKPLSSSVELSMDLNVEGRGLRMLDHEPVDGLYPVYQWEPGKIVRDDFLYEIPRTWSTETFDLFVGFRKGSESFPPVKGDHRLSERGLPFVTMLQYERSPQPVTSRPAP